MNSKSLGIVVAMLLIVSQIPGCIEKGTETAKNVAPSVIINANVTTGYAPLEVAFTANATDPDGYIVNYTWNFGEENISYEQNPVHTFTKNNTYNVTLTVEDNNGSTATDNIWITAIEIGPENQPPTADANGPYDGNLGETIEFDGSGSYDPDGYIEDWYWEFGDGDTGSGEYATHSYSNPDTYTVTLTVTDNNGESNSDSTQIEIASPEKIPLELKIWAAENYGDGNCITDDTGDHIGTACLADSIEPLPPGYIKDDVCNEDFIMWVYQNVGWCVPEVKMMCMSASSSPTICDWIDSIGVHNLTIDHALYVYALSQGATNSANRKYDELSPKPDPLPTELATLDNALGIYYYSQGCIDLGNMKTGCKYICDWIDTIGVNNLTKHHVLYTYFLYKNWTSLANREYNASDPKPDPLSIDLATKDNVLGIYYYYKGWFDLGNMKTGCDYERIENLTVYFIDAGQGDSFLIELPEKRYVMIDAGYDYHSNDVSSFLNSMSITTLEAFIATHPDADHIGGADEVLEAFDVSSIYHSGYEKDTIAYQEFIAAAENEGCPIYTDDDIDPGDFLDFNSCVTFQVMHIDKNAPNSNDASIVLRVDYDDVSFLFPGDIKSDVENEIIQDPNLDFDIDILKVAHHGSKYSTCNAFLDATTPSIGVISVGDNPYGHPTDETLNRLKNHGVTIYRTDLNGTITITTGGKNWDISCEKVGANNPPTAEFTYTIEGLTVHFTDTSSDPDGDPLTHYWEFGDGYTSTEENPIHTYSMADTYQVILTVNDGTTTDSISKYVTVDEQPPPADHIVINEIEQNPPGHDSYSTTMEWIELYNPTSTPVDLSGWTLSTTHENTVTVTLYRTIEAKSYYVFKRSRWLDNNDESVILRDAYGNEIDRTLVASDTRNDNRSWQRIPNGYDSDNNSDWDFRYATKGYSNS